MSKRIVIQMGHINCANNTIVALRNNTGAPGEQEVNKRIADRVSAMCRERGIEVIQTDANANSDTKVTKQDHDLFISLHCDADYPNDGGSGFADFPQPATDGATVESQKAAAIFNDVYFKETKINYVNHSNANTRYYYMWKYLTAKTPCVLIELGQCQDPHDKVLLGNTELIASALVRAICKYFGIAYDLTTQTSSNTSQPSAPTIITDDKTKIDLGTSYGVKTLKQIKDLVIKLDFEYSEIQKSNRDLMLDKSNLTSKIENIKLIVNQ